MSWYNQQSTILSTIVHEVRKETNTNLWKSTKEVTDWFNTIQNKNDYTFIVFDICEFYPSISQQLLNDAITYASNYVPISNLEKRLIINTKNSTLYNNGIPWTKKNSENFDITMGSFDGAECCELVGLYIPSKLSQLEINVGLYRDDGLAVCKLSPQKTENIKKRCANFLSLLVLTLQLKQTKND